MTACLFSCTVRALFLLLLVVNSSAADCNTYCAILNGRSSSCANWYGYQICTFGYQSCGFGLCGNTTTTKTPASTTKTPTTLPPILYLATCNADAYCTELVGNGSLCRTNWRGTYCTGSRVSCTCTAVNAEQTATTKFPVPTDPPTTTVKPTTAPVVPTTSTPIPSSPTPTTPAPTGNCAASSNMDLFIWTEWPSLTDPAAASTYYSGLLGFMSANCIGARIPRLILRVLHPQYPSVSNSFYTPSKTSILYSAFLSKIPTNTQLIIYPYVMEQPAGVAWMANGAPNPVEGTVQFMKSWNTLLAGSGLSFSGIVLDMEELPGLNSYSSFQVTAASVSSLKAKYGAFEFGITAGFDQIGVIQNSVGFVDKIYLELYDFYTPYVNVGHTTDSKFLTMKNEATAFGDFVLTSAIAPSVLSAYAQYPDKLMAMWSNQNLVGKCLYPLDGISKCGANYEFGVWDPLAFNSFVTYVKTKSPALSKLQHGIFQYSFTPPNWIP